jgi:hypothetical protein
VPLTLVYSSNTGITNLRLIAAFSFNFNLFLLGSQQFSGGSWLCAPWFNPAAQDLAQQGEFGQKQIGKCR